MTSPRERGRVLGVPAGVANLVRREGGETTESINIRGLNVRRYPDKRTAIVTTREPTLDGELRLLVVQDGRPWGGFAFGGTRFRERVGIVVFRPDGTLRMGGLAFPDCTGGEVIFCSGAN